MRRVEAVAARWLLWGGMLVVSTAALLWKRQPIEQTHAVLVLLLVVLGGSMAGGRPLGYTLAWVSFALIDYYFQPPFDSFTINKPLDWVALVAFLAIAAVTTELLSRTRQEAALAGHRAGEVESLSRLGAATLRRADPAEALREMAALVRETLALAACSVFARTTEADPALVAIAVGEALGVSTVTAPEREAARRAIADGRSVACDAAGSWTHVDLPTDERASAGLVDARLLALPLHADDRVIGALVVRREPVLSLDVARRRFLFALAYYAALGLERMRLVDEASRTIALLEANRTKDQILASVSHDLRTPLTTIKVLAQRIEARDDPAAAAIVEQADRLARMVADLLELSRLRAGRHQMGSELNTADDVIGAALRRAQGVLGDRTIVPHIDLDSPALVGEFDFVDTLRIIGNLLDNAIRHSPPRGVIDLVVARDDGWLCFTVADRGTGVAPSERERIFEAFYRPSSALPDAGHAGLGLSIAKALAEVQGGTLDYVNRAGGGSEFVLRLPAAEAGPEDETE